MLSFKTSFLFYRENYILLQIGFRHLAYEKREVVASYGMESLFGKEVYLKIIYNTVHIPAVVTV